MRHMWISAGAGIAAVLHGCGSSSPAAPSTAVQHVVPTQFYSETAPELVVHKHVSEGDAVVMNGYLKWLDSRAEIAFLRGFNAMELFYQLEHGSALGARGFTDQVFHFEQYVSLPPKEGEKEAQVLRIPIQLEVHVPYLKLLVRYAYLDYEGQQQEANHAVASSGKGNAKKTEDGVVELFPGATMRDCEDQKYPAIWVHVSSDAETRKFYIGIDQMGELVKGVDVEKRSPVSITLRSDGPKTASDGSKIAKCTTFSVGERFYEYLARFQKFCEQTIETHLAVAHAVHQFSSPPKGFEYLYAPESGATLVAFEEAGPDSMLGPGSADGHWRELPRMQVPKAMQAIRSLYGTAKRDIVVKDSKSTKLWNEEEQKDLTEGETAAAASSVSTTHAKGSGKSASASGTLTTDAVVALRSPAGSSSGSEGVGDPTNAASGKASDSASKAESAASARPTTASVTLIPPGPLVVHHRGVTRKTYSQELFRAVSLNRALRLVTDGKPASLRKLVKKPSPISSGKFIKVLQLLELPARKTTAKSTANSGDELEPKGKKRAIRKSAGKKVDDDIVEDEEDDDSFAGNPIDSV